MELLWAPCSLVVPLQLLLAFFCGHPECFLPVKINIYFSSPGKASCQTPHQTLGRKHALHHSSRVGDMNSASPKLAGRSPAPFLSTSFLVCLPLSAIWNDASWPSGQQPPLPCPSAVAPSKLPCRFLETFPDPNASGHAGSIPQGSGLKRDNTVPPWNNSTSSSSLGFNYSYFQPNVPQISR